MKKLFWGIMLVSVFIIWFRIDMASQPADLSIKSDKPDLKATIFTREEQEWIEAHKDTEFSVGVAMDYIPVEYIDQSNKPRGMGIELLKKVHQLTGLNFKLYENSKNETWEEILQSTRAKRVDVLSNVSLTQERTEYLAFSVPYIEITQVILASKDTTQLVQDFSQIKDSTFVVPKGYWFLDIILNEIPQAKIIEVTNMEEALQYVSAKKADYTICEIPVFTYYKEQSQYKDIKIVGELKEKNRIFIGVTKDLHELIPIINKVIQNINYAEIYEQSMVIPKNSLIEQKLVALTGILGVILFIVVYYLYRTFNKLTKSKKEAEKANRDKTRLMTNISHDLRTPITVIIGYAQALIDGEVKKEADKEKYIKRVYEKTKYLSAMVDDFFLLARLEDNNLTMNKESVRIDGFLQQITEDAELKAREKEIVLSLAVDETAAVMKNIDKVKFYRAIENILTNAIKYTGQGGKIGISLLPAKDGQVKIAIKDNGTGIRKEDIPYIFDRYYKGENAKKESIGLGLYIAREIIHKHHGELWVQSEVNRGSIFYVRI